MYDLPGWISLYWRNSCDIIFCWPHHNFQIGVLPLTVVIFSWIYPTLSCLTSLPWLLILGLNRNVSIFHTLFMTSWYTPSGHPWLVWFGWMLPIIILFPQYHKLLWLCHWSHAEFPVPSFRLTQYLLLPSLIGVLFYDTPNHKANLWCRVWPQINSLSRCTLQPLQAALLLACYDLEVLPLYSLPHKWSCWGFPGWWFYDILLMCGR